MGECYPSGTGLHSRRAGRGDGRFPGTWSSPAWRRTPPCRQGNGDWGRKAGREGEGREEREEGGREERETHGVALAAMAKACRLAENAAWSRAGGTAEAGSNSSATGRVSLPKSFCHGRGIADSKSSPPSSKHSLNKPCPPSIPRHSTHRTSSGKFHALRAVTRAHEASCSREYATMAAVSNGEKSVGACHQGCAEAHGRREWCTHELGAVLAQGHDAGTVPRHADAEREQSEGGERGWGGSGGRK